MPPDKKWQLRRFMKILKLIFPSFPLPFFSQEKGKGLGDGFSWISFIISLFLITPCQASVLTLTDLSNATGLVDARIQGAAVTPKVDSVRYRNLTPRDTLVSGHYKNSLSFPVYAVWPTIASTAEGEFNISYLFYKDNVSGPGGNYYMEKLFRIDTLNKCINFFTLPFASQADDDSAGTFLSKRIMPTSGVGLYTGGVNTKTLIGPNKRVYRVCAGYGGGSDSIYVLDTAETGLGASYQYFITSLDTADINNKTFPDFCINSRGDTIFAAYTPNGSVSPPLLRVTPICIKGRDTVSKGILTTILSSAASSRRDISIDRDSATGKFLIACLKNDNILELTSTNADLTSPVSIDAKTGLPSISQISRNIRVAALGHQRFAIAFWMTLNGSGGVHMRIVDISAGVNVVDSVVLEPNAGLVPSLSVQNNRLAAVWLKDTRPGANTGRVFGKIFTLQNGLIADTLFSGALSGDSTITKLVNTAPGNYCMAVALDTAGNIAAAYAKQDSSVYLTSWAPLFYFADTSSAIVEDSLDKTSWGSFNGDSIIYTGFNAINSGNGGSANISFRTSTSSSFVSTFDPVVTASVKGPVAGSHFQFNIQMIAALNALTRPLVSSLSLGFNVKPRNAKIDSFAINSGAYQKAGDTITVLPRSDTLKLVASGEDYDDASYLTLTVNGYFSSVNVMSRDSSRHYSKRFTILPVNYRDTVFPLKVTVKDTTNWSSDTFTVYIRLRNALPTLIASDTVFLFDSKSGHLLANNDTVRFMNRHKAVFRADFTDLNDPLGLDGRTYINGVLHRSSTHSTTLFDTLTDKDFGNDTCRFSIAVNDSSLGSDSISITVISYNLRPSLTASDTVFLFNNKTGNALNNNDTVRFMNRHKVVFRSDFTDINDPDSLGGRTYVNGILRRSYSNVKVLYDTLTDHDFNNDTCRFSIAVTDPSRGSDSISVTVISYNLPPSLTASDTVYLFNNKTGHVLNNQDTVRFMKKHKTVFRSDFIDVNDPLTLNSRTYLNGVLHRSFTNRTTILDTVTSVEMARDTIAYSITVSDSSLSTDSNVFTLIAYNRPPSDSLRKQSFDVRNVSSPDTFLTEGETLFVIDSGYTVIRALGRDSNETDLSHYLVFNGKKLDSASGSLNFIDTIYADSITGLDTMSVIVRDAFTTDTTIFFARVSHVPILDSIVYKNSGLTLKGNTVNVKTINGVPDTFIIHATDPDVVLDDRLTYRMTQNNGTDTSVETNSLTGLLIHHSGRTDTSALFRVSDRSGMVKQMVIRFLYPSFEKGPHFVSDSIYFMDSISLYVTRVNKLNDSISAESHAVKIINFGTDTLRFLSAGTVSGSDNGWIKMGYASNSKLTNVTYSKSISAPRILLPGDSLFLAIRDSAATAFGDSAGFLLSLGNADTVVIDTLLFATNDPERSPLRIPIRIFCRESPYVIRDTVVFIGSVPPLPKGKSVSAYNPKNAVYREVAMVFSEPMDHSTAGYASFSVYSQADSFYYAMGKPDTVAPFPGQYRWSKGSESRFDTLFFRPSLASGNYVSRFFNITPLDGYYISSDPVRVKVSSSITDISGNRMDLYQDYTPDSIRGFRIFKGQIDSSSLRVLSMDPQNGSEGAPSLPRITIRFSNILDSLSIDTASINNRSFKLISSINPSAEIVFKNGVSLSGNVISFLSGTKFYSNDSVSVIVSSSLRDINRNTLDGNNDGRGNFFYKYGFATYKMADTMITDETASAGDNYRFSFRIAREDFYFYPCPYEPGRNPRHEALGGIVFKNLHSLFKSTLSGTLNVRIYNVSGDLVYSTDKQSEAILFGGRYGSLSKPEWTWKVTNNKKVPVGSGLYLFVISDGDDKNVLNRGKLIVIR